MPGAVAENGAAVPDALAPPPRHPRFPLLDGMRAIAVLSVLVVHVAVLARLGTTPAARLLTHLNVGVTIFFLISGFLLYRPFIAHRAGGAEAPALPDYARRRLLRIVPAYWVVLTVLTLLPGTTGVSGGEWAGQYSLTFTLPFAQADGGGCLGNIDCGLAQTWSLVVEFTFYAALPLWFLLSERLARGRSTRAWVSLELALLAGLSAASVLVHFGGTQGSVLNTYAGGSVLGFVVWFALGMGLAIVSVALGDRRPRAIELIGRFPAVPWLAALVAYAILCASVPATPYVIDGSQQLAVHLVFGLVALLLMLPAVFADDAGGLPRALLRHPVVAWIGLVSYGVFLWHYVIALELGGQGENLTFWPLLGVTVVLSLAVAAISYYAVERPLLRFKYRRTPPPAIEADARPSV